MCAGLTLALSAIDHRLIQQRGLMDRAMNLPDGRPALRFLFRDREPLLPVRLDGVTAVAPWGNRDVGIPGCRVPAGAG